MGFSTIDTDSKIENRIATQFQGWITMLNGDLASLYKNWGAQAEMTVDDGSSHEDLETATTVLQSLEEIETCQVEMSRAQKSLDDIKDNFGQTLESCDALLSNLASLSKRYIASLKTYEGHVKNETNPHASQKECDHNQFNHKITSALKVARTASSRGKSASDASSTDSHTTATTMEALATQQEKLLRQANQNESEFEQLIAQQAAEHQKILAAAEAQFATKMAEQQTKYESDKMTLLAAQQKELDALEIAVEADVRFENEIKHPFLQSETSVPLLTQGITFTHRQIKGLFGLARSSVGRLMDSRLGILNPQSLKDQRKTMVDFIKKMDTDASAHPQDVHNLIENFTQAASSALDVTSVGNHPQNSPKGLIFEQEVMNGIQGLSDTLKNNFMGFSLPDALFRILQLDGQQWHIALQRQTHRANQLEARVNELEQHLEAALQLTQQQPSTVPLLPTAKKAATLNLQESSFDLASQFANSQFFSGPVAKRKGKTLSGATLVDFSIEESSTNNTEPFSPESVKNT